MRAAGFSKKPGSEYETEAFLDSIIHSADKREAVREGDENRAFLEFTRFFGPNIGIRVCGEMDGFGFRRQYYYPFLDSTNLSTDAELSFETKTDGLGYMGAAEDGRAGITLIFFLQNPALFKKKSFFNMIRQMREERPGGKPVTTTLTGLAQAGTILLPGKKVPVSKTSEQRNYYDQYERNVIAARNGDQEAAEILTREDMDLYAMISRRIQKEDVLTIVNSYIMPYGLQSDQYQVLGTILFYTKVQNAITKEYLYQMTLDCNGIILDICINKNDLYGDPEEGRRFKGNIWLQGKVSL